MLYELINLKPVFLAVVVSLAILGIMSSLMVPLSAAVFYMNFDFANFILCFHIVTDNGINCYK
jgi:hypothetical protein